MHGVRGAGRGCVRGQELPRHAGSWPHAAGAVRLQQPPSSSSVGCGPVLRHGELQPAGSLLRWPGRAGSACARRGSRPGAGRALCGAHPPSSPARAGCWPAAAEPGTVPHGWVHAANLVRGCPGGCNRVPEPEEHVRGACSPTPPASALFFSWPGCCKASGKAVAQTLMKCHTKIIL